MKTDWKHLKIKLQLDWSLLADDYKYVAIDEDGAIFAHQEEPYCIIDTWESDCNSLGLGIVGNFDTNLWKLSLIERP